jgi:hypothetical protein
VRDSVTADDLAIEAAKEKLVELVDRDDYKAAIAKEQTRELGPRITVTIMFVVSAVGAIALGFIAHGLMWIWVVLLALLSLLMGLACIGFAQDKPGEPVGVAILGKTQDAKNITEAELLRTDGETVTAIVPDRIFNLVRPGDLGVAWLRKDSRFVVVTDFVRL